MRLRDELSGEVRFNGEVMSREKMTRISGFAAQNDVMLDGITVREHLYFMVSGKWNFHHLCSTLHTFHDPHLDRIKTSLHLGTREATSYSQFVKQIRTACAYQITVSVGRREEET